MEKIRILALHLGCGGVEKAVCSMANLFAERYEVEIVCVYELPNAPAYHINERVKLHYLLDAVPNREAWKRAMKSLAPFRFARESLRALGILRAKKRAVRDFIASVEDGVLITTRHEDNLALSKYGRSTVRKIAQLHHDHEFKRHYVRGFRRGYANVDVFALLTPKLRDELCAIMRGNHHTEILCIPNFVNIPGAALEEQREKTVLAVGRLVKVKGFDRLIESFSRLHRSYPDWKLKIVGEGGERRRLEKLIARYGLCNCVTLTGELGAEDVQREIRRASIYAMTSHSEGFALVIIEAFSCALPCVAYDVRVGPGAIIENGRSGILVPDGDFACFERSLAELIEDPARRVSMGQSAYERAHDFSAEKLAEIWFDVLSGEKLA